MSDDLLQIFGIETVTDENGLLVGFKKTSDVDHTFILGHLLTLISNDTPTEYIKVFLDGFLESFSDQNYSKK